MKTYKVAFALLAATVLLLGTVSTATAGASSQRVPYSETVEVPCALGGDGENVKLTGTLHIVTHMVLDDNGRFHCFIHHQPQGVTGEGVESGDIYHGTGITRENTNTISGASLPVEFTSVNNYRIIGPGPGNNWLVHMTIHYTINADGEVTADIDNTSVECQ